MGEHGGAPRRIRIAWRLLPVSLTATTAAARIKTHLQGLVYERDEMPFSYNSLAINVRAPGGGGTRALVSAILQQGIEYRRGKKRLAELEDAGGV